MIVHRVLFWDGWVREVCWWILAMINDVFWLWKLLNRWMLNWIQCIMLKLLQLVSITVSPPMGRRLLDPAAIIVVLLLVILGIGVGVYYCRLEVIEKKKECIQWSTLPFKH